MTTTAPTVRPISGRRHYSVRVYTPIAVPLVRKTAPEVKAERNGLPVFGCVASLCGAHLEVRGDNETVRVVQDAYALEPTEELWLVPDSGEQQYEVLIVEGFTP